MAHLLIVEDDELLRDALGAQLAQAGHRITTAADGAEALELLALQGFDGVVLDLGLPLVDGLTVLRRLRQRLPALPVLILTARDGVADRIAGLDAGADDYLVKPFDVDELKARIRALLRRSFSRAQPVLEYREVSLDPVAQQVSYRGQPVALQRKEFLLLHELLAQPGRVLTRDRLQQVLYGWDEEAESNALEVHIHHLRKKLFPELIRTVRGVGYLVDKA